MNVTPKRLAQLFNEWNARYAENPEAFADCVDSEGTPIEGYGEQCVHYLTELDMELS